MRRCAERTALRLGVTTKTRVEGPMRGRLTWSVLLLGLVAIGGGSGPAFGQATRTWVSGVGDDANPCSRTAPCKTFAGAISKTASGGEISVLDLGGFGAVTVTKSISLTNDGAGEAGILASFTNGIIVNGTNIVVNVRGLIIDGAGTGLNGIRFLNGSVLNVQNTVIKNFAASNGTGILFSPSAAAQLNVSHTVISQNGTTTTGGGIIVQPTGTERALVALDHIQLLGNYMGVRVNAGGGPVAVTIAEGTAAGNLANGVHGQSTGGSVSFMLDRVASVNNARGIAAASGNVVIGMMNSVVTGNTVIGVLTSGGGAIESLQNNAVRYNAVEGTAALAPVAPN